MINTVPIVARSLQKLQNLIYLANGSWIAPPGVTTAIITGYGGGGQGGGGYGPPAAASGNWAPGGGGGGGSLQSTVIVAVVPGTTYTITIGAGGTGGGGGGAGTDQTGTDGADGANTTFGSLATFKGGGFGAGAKRKSTVITTLEYTRGGSASGNSGFGYLLGHVTITAVATPSSMLVATPGNGGFGITNNTGDNTHSMAETNPVGNGTSGAVGAMGLDSSAGAGPYRGGGPGGTGGVGPGSGASGNGGAGGNQGGVSGGAGGNAPANSGHGGGGGGGGGDSSGSPSGPGGNGGNGGSGSCTVSWIQ